MQNIHFKEKKGTKKFIWAKTCAERNEEIRKRSGLKWNKMGVPTGQDPTQLSCYLVKEKDLGSFLFLKSNNKGKCLQMQKASLHPLPLRLTRSQTFLKSGIPPPSSLACPDIVGIEVDYLCSLSQPPPFESAPKLQNCYLGTATTFQQPSLFWALTNSQLVFHKRLSCHYAWLTKSGFNRTLLV